MLAELLVTGDLPAAVTRLPEPGDQPAGLGQDRAAAAGTGADVLLERSPAGQPMLAGDGELGVVQCRELPGGQPPFRLHLEIPQAGLVRERT
jgi:hypothetical protein